MKILNLTFKNINSLAGENKIDFTQSVFTNEGLFAITGKTGAGKSSILDAIALALYGKTPRVEITSSENAVMTKGEKDCYSEIVFEVAGKIWKSSWKQECTKTGNLKPVNRVIADLNNKIVADQVRSCDTKIVEIIGLTFEQFTKVIMLAQGSFAAFLQAKPNEKGELLEQITGTEIYAEISKKVFERNKNEKEKLEKILVELQTIKILSTDEITTLNDEIISAENEKTLLDKKIQQINTAQKWFTDCDELQKQIKETQEQLPDLTEKAKKTNETFIDFEKKLNQLKEEQKKNEPIFKIVRQLDTQISEKENQLKPIAKNIDELTESKKNLTQKLTDLNANLTTLKTSLNQKQDWAKENSKYQNLVSNYLLIEQENQSLVNSSKEISTIEQDISDLKEDFDKKTAKLNEAKNSFEETENKINQQNTELKNKKNELKTLLEGKEINLLQNEKEHIATFGIQLKNFTELEIKIQSNQQEIETYKNDLTSFENSKKELLEKIATDKENQQNIDSQAKTLAENIELTKIIQSLDEHRQKLEDGKECPLCGALEHPFATTNIPQLNEKETQLETLKKQLDILNKSIQEDEKKIEKLNSDYENTTKNIQKEHQILTDNLNTQKEKLAKLKEIEPSFCVPEGDTKIEELNEILAKKRNDLKKINELLSKTTEIENTIIQIRDELIPKSQSEKETKTTTKNTAETNQKLAQQQLENKQNLLSEIKLKTKNNKATLLEKLKEYNVETIEKLKECLDNWTKNQDDISEESSKITSIENNISLTNKEIENETKKLAEKQTEKQNIETEKQKLVDERKQYFEEKSVEEEEEKLKTSIENTEKQKSNSEEEKNNAHTELAKNNAVITEKIKALEALKATKNTEKTSEELQIELKEYKEKTDCFSQKIGAHKQMLKANLENSKQNTQKLKEKEKQENICNKWAKLNELIGSGDGKKYRNFAQSLTFEHLISLSNKQLKRMSERYLLKRVGDNSNPFELSVIDGFQNGEERTAQNLSGGEKFILSLALALGLSNMASKNMRIDTMFIDEGFGTLDTDYLDVALTALSNLQSEGKIIGVISHLTELKEQIATHIEVFPSGNGYSKIKITNQNLLQ